MKTPLWLIDTICAFTMNFGNKWYDPDCDGVVYHYDWFGFHAKFVDYDNHIYGHGIYRDYPNRYDSDDIPDFHPFASKVNSIFQRVSRFQKTTKKMLKLLRFAGILWIKHPVSTIKVIRACYKKGLV